jgi:hypothetical protein
MKPAVKSLFVIASLLSLALLFSALSAYLPESACLGKDFSNNILFFGLLGVLVIGSFVGFFVGKLLFRKLPWAVLAGLGLGFILVFCFAKAQNILIRSAVARAIERGEIVISAIDQYKITSGRFPESLSDLGVKIPTSNICAFQNFEYEKYDEAGGYQLSVSMPSGGINWDVLVYRPNGNYPDHMEGGWPERFGKWVYVHE